LRRACGQQCSWAYLGGNSNNSLRSRVEQADSEVER
jgi:hypothetical protein